jgi:hypothetical protein
MSTFYWDPVAPTIVLSTGVGNLENREVVYPLHYELAVTPHLKFFNRDDQLNVYNPSKPLLSNSQLFLTGGLSVDSGNTTLDLDSCRLWSNVDVSSVIKPEFEEYLWSIRAVDLYGTPSEWGPIQKFVGITKGLARKFTVTQPIDPHPYQTIKLHGTKEPEIRTIEINDDATFASYPTPTTWEYETTLTTGVNEFSVRAFDRAGGFSVAQKVETSIYTGLTERHEYYNTFDDFGAKVAVDRIRSLDETNVSYKTRIKDATNHRAGTALIGLHFGIARNLNLTYDDTALLIRPAVVTSIYRSDRLYRDLQLHIRTNHIAIGSKDFEVEHEHHTIRPQDLRVKLNNSLFAHVAEPDENIRVHLPIGVEMSVSEYDVDIDNDEIVFREGFGGVDIWVSYSREYRVDIGPDIGLQTLATALAALKHNDHTLITAVLSSSRSDSDSSDGLLRLSDRLRGNQRFRDVDEVEQFGLPIRWTDLSLHSLLDTDFQKRHLSEGHLLNTIVEGYVNSFKNKAHFSWETTIVDDDIWDPVDPYTENAGVLPPVLDPMRGYWTSSSINDTVRYSFTEALDRGFISEVDKTELVYVGIPTTDFKSGVGRESDLVDGPRDLKVVIKKPKKTETLTPIKTFRITVTYQTEGQLDDASFLPGTIFGGLLFEE